MRWYNPSGADPGYVRDREMLYHEFGKTFVWIRVSTAEDLGYRHPHAELTSC